MDILVAARGWRADLPEGRRGSAAPQDTRPDSIVTLDDDEPRDPPTTPLWVLGMALFTGGALAYLLWAAVAGLVSG